MKAWTVDPDLVRKVRQYILTLTTGADAIVDFDEVRTEVQAMADLLLPQSRPMRVEILGAAAFSVRLGAGRNEAARLAYRELLPAELKRRVSLERYVERRTCVASLLGGVDSMLGFYDPIADLVCLRSLPRARLLEVALREELRRYFRRDLPEPYRSLPEGAAESTSMEHAMATVAIERYLRPMLDPAEVEYPRDTGPRQTWQDVFGDDQDALRVFAGTACRQFVSNLPRHYDFASAQHLERVAATYREDAETLAGFELLT